MTRGGSSFSDPLDPFIGTPDGWTPGGGGFDPPVDPFDPFIPGGGGTEFHPPGDDEDPPTDPPVIGADPGGFFPGAIGGGTTISVLAPPRVPRTQRFLWDLGRVGPVAAAGSTELLVRLPPLVNLGETVNAGSEPVAILDSRMALMGGIVMIDTAWATAWYVQVWENIGVETIRYMVFRQRAEKPTHDGSSVTLDGIPYPVLGGYVRYENPDPASKSVLGRIYAINSLPWK